MLAQGDLDDLKLLILPSPYYLTAEEAAVLDQWVRRGGVALVEAHLGGYNASTGRHSLQIPGCGLAESWGIHEIDSTSSYHLHLEHAQAFAGSSPEDVRKALAGQAVSGGNTTRSKRRTMGPAAKSFGAPCATPISPVRIGLLWDHLRPAQCVWQPKRSV
jgi:hypothetical protein